MSQLDDEVTVVITNKPDSELYAVFEESNFDVNVGESAKIDVGTAINYIQSGQAEIAETVGDIIGEFNENAVEKTNQFNTNAEDKTADFNLNALNKTNDFNTNAINKTTAFDDNATSKTGAFDDNVADKTNAFNLNATDKTTAFNNNYTEKKALIDAEVQSAEIAATNALNYSAEAKQWAIGDPSEPTGYSSKYWAEASASAAATVGNGTITLTQGGVTKGTFTTNQSGDTTINLDAGGGDQPTIDDAISTTSTNAVQNKAIPSYIVSRGQNLVSNGFSTLGNNYNFSTMTYTGADTYGAGGCFYYTSSTSGRVRSDEYMPIDITQSYKLSYAVKNTTLTSTYDFIDMYDIDFNRIAKGNCDFTAGTTTTLAQDLKNGDTVIYFTDLSNWDTTSTSQYLHALIFWKYKNSFGYEYPTEYYSRYWWYNLWADSSVAIDKVNNTITLPSGWTHGSFSAGHPVSQGALSGANVYGNSNYQPTPNEWTVKTYTFDPSKYRNATAYIQLGWLTNYSNQTDNTFSISSISFTSNVDLIDFIAYTAAEVETLWESI